MTTKSQLVIPASDFNDYPDHDIVSKFTKFTTKYICQRSNKPIDECEDSYCASVFTHKTRMEYVPVDYLVISKSEQNICP